MHTTIVYVQVKPEYVEDFIKASRANHLESVKEPGNLRFDFLQMKDDPTCFVFYEAYKSAEDVNLHKQTTHYQKWRDTVADWMATTRQGVIYKGICPNIEDVA